MRSTFDIPFACLALVLLAGPACAQAALPAQASYAARIEETATAKICEIALNVTSRSTAEVLSVVAFVGQSMTNATMLNGFVVSATEVVETSEGSDVTRVKLATAGFSSPSFSSDGLDHEIDDLGSVWIWTAAEHSAAFLKAFTSGDFTLTISRIGSPDITRTYRISLGPPEAVTRDFVACLKDLGRLPRLS